jgi:hypothetical protein
MVQLARKQSKSSHFNYRSNSSASSLRSTSTWISRFKSSLKSIDNGVLLHSKLSRCGVVCYSQIMQFLGPSELDPCTHAALRDKRLAYSIDPESSPNSKSLLFSGPKRVIRPRQRCGPAYSKPWDIRHFTEFHSFVSSSTPR